MARPRVGVVVLAVVMFAGGYLVGREHLKYQMRRALEVAAASFTRGISAHSAESDHAFRRKVTARTDGK